MQLELSAQEVFIGFAIISMMVIFLITTLRLYFRSKNHPNPKEDKYQLSKRVKYASVDVLRHSKRIFGLALSISLLTVICGFSWTTYDRSYVVIACSFGIDDFIDTEPPIINPPAPKPPPPPEPIIEEIPIDEPFEEADDLPDMAISDEEPITEPALPIKKEEPIELPPLPVPIKDDAPEIFKVVEQMPLFGGCTDKACSEKALFQFLYKHLKYPSIAKENGVEGKVYIQFVVERDGSITDAKIVRDAGAGLGAESMRVVQKLKDLPRGFEPGRQRGEAVRVLFTLPVTFKLTK